VEIDEGYYCGIFVVIGYKKNIFNKTLFHLCAEKGDEFWIRLQRIDEITVKKGIVFRPLRKVATVEQFVTSVNPIAEDDLMMMK
jgi:pentose-5-phosphate-3-epimerase